MHYSRIEHLKSELTRLPVVVRGELVETTDSDYVLNYAMEVLGEIRQLRHETKKRDPPFLERFSTTWRTKIEELVPPTIKVGEARSYNVFPTTMGLFKVSESWRKLYAADKIKLGNYFVLEAEELPQEEIISHYKVLLCSPHSIFQMIRHLFFWKDVYVLHNSPKTGLDKCWHEVTKVLLPPR